MSRDRPKSEIFTTMFWPTCIKKRMSTKATKSEKTHQAVSSGEVAVHVVVAGEVLHACCHLGSSVETSQYECDMNRTDEVKEFTRQTLDSVS